MKIIRILILAMIFSSLLIISTASVTAADKTIFDAEDDVMDIEGEFVTYPNIDIKELTYTKVGTKVTLTMEVYGVIENLGSLTGISDFITYAFTLTTSLDFYNIMYVNELCFLIYGGGEENITDFTVTDSILEVNFNINSTTETYETLEGDSAFLGISGEGAYYIDTAGDLPLQVGGDIPNLGETGKDVDFIGLPLYGQSPYEYHWDFGDGSTSNEKNPTHIYTKAGTYNVNFTVTDNDGGTASFSGTIEITGDSVGDGEDSPIIMFIVVIVVIAVIGIIAVVYIIRR